MPLISSIGSILKYPLIYFRILSRLEATKLLAPQSCADEYGRLHVLACDAATRAEVIEGSMTPNYADTNQLQMLGEAGRRLWAT